MHKERNYTVDKNSKGQWMLKWSYRIYQLPNGSIKMKNQGKLTVPRWYYKDDPWYGIGCKENINKFRMVENLAPYEIT